MPALYDNLSPDSDKPIPQAVYAQASHAQYAQQMNQMYAQVTIQHLSLKL